MSVEVVWVVDDDVVVHFALYEHIVMIKSEAGFHVLLMPIHSHGQVLPSALLNALLLSLEVEVVFTILELHSVVIDAPLQ